MPEAKNYVFGYTELAEILVKKLDIHEGLWGLYFEFSFGGANVPTAPDSKTLAPAALTLIKGVGVQRFDAPNNLTIDAAEVNPAPGKPPAH
ncbi:MAG TPA: hypothetical protein VI431_02275 [Candidatus Acidoferrum sp.]